jgi:hypothetical protein
VVVVSTRIASLVILTACTAPNPAFCPNGTTADGDCNVGDAGSAGQLCFGRSTFVYCVDTTPTAPYAVMTGTTIDTDSSDCTATTTDGTACVMMGTDVTLGAQLTAHGSHPLIIYASQTLTLTAAAVVDAAAGSTEAGPGADIACGSAANPTGTTMGGGGGAGGTFGSLGGPGGTGGGGAIGGMPATMPEHPTTLQGGCSGSPGANVVATTSTAGAAGLGGGGVYLVADGSMMLAGTIDASGAGGGPGHASRGGAGGGGGGGGGAANSSDGSAGTTPTSADAVPMGGMATAGGAGGAGAYETIPAMAGGMAGGGGGGAGGGGAGIVHVLMGDISNATVSPPPT